MDCCLAGRSRASLAFSWAAAVSQLPPHPDWQQPRRQASGGVGGTDQLQKVGTVLHCKSKYPAAAAVLPASRLVPLAFSKRLAVVGQIDRSRAALTTSRLSDAASAVALDRPNKLASPPPPNCTAYLWKDGSS